MKVLNNICISNLAFIYVVCQQRNGTSVLPEMKSVSGLPSEPLADFKRFFPVAFLLTVGSVFTAIYKSCTSIKAALMCSIKQLTMP